MEKTLYLLLILAGGVSAQSLEQASPDELANARFSYCDDRRCRFNNGDEEYSVRGSNLRRADSDGEVFDRELVSGNDEITASVMSARGNVIAVAIRTVTMSRRGFGTGLARPDDLDRSFRLELYNPRSSALIKSFDLGAFSVSDMSLADDGEILFVAGQNLERRGLREVRSFNTRSGTQIATSTVNDLDDVRLFANGYLVDGRAFSLQRDIGGIQVFNSRDPFSIAEYEVNCASGLVSEIGLLNHSIGVLPISSNMNNSDLLHSGVLSALSNTELTLVERDNLRAVLEEIQLSQSGITSTEIIVDIGNMLAASHLVSGDVSRVGQDIVLQVRAIATETSAIVSSCTMQCRDCLDQDLFEGTNRMMEVWAR